MASLMLGAPAESPAAMTEERAVVVTNDGSHVWVEAQRQSTCGQCSVNKGCGTAVLNGVLGVRRTRVRAKTEILDLQPGEIVIVGMRDAALLKSAAAIFGVPIVLMLLAAIFGTWVLQQFGAAAGEGARIVLGFVGLAAGVVWTMYWAARQKNDGRDGLRVLRRAPAASVFVPIVRHV